MAADKNLYFIPILAKAFDAADVATALTAALREIVRLGKLPAYHDGFEQFEQFVASGISGVSRDTEDFAQLQAMVLQRLLTQLATDTFDGSDEVRESLIQKIRCNPELAQRYQALQAALKESEPPLAIELYQNERLQSVQPLAGAGQRLLFDNIVPGDYAIRLSNGRVLWQGRVAAEDVVWHVAFPGKAYPMAAATESGKGTQTKSVDILNGEMTLTFYAGFESGSIQVFFKRER